MPDAVHVKPIVGQHFAARDRVSDTIDENLRATAGQAAESRRLQPFEHRAKRQLRDFREVVDLRRAEAVDVDLRETTSDIVKQLFVPLKLELGVEAALH